MSLDLPSVIPVFPLAQAIVLPRGRLPLNIFEPRYLKMTDDALRGERHIGMIQPRTTQKTPDLHSVGCLARMTSWEDTGDGRYFITLVGVCRFRVVEEMAAATPYRQVRADYREFEEDIGDPQEVEIDRPSLFANLETYLKGQKLEADWTAIAKTPSDALVNSLSMMCPFGPAEKQALIEARSLAERAAVLVALIEMAAAGSGGTRLQ
jgi:uncharacterized protein